MFNELHFNRSSSIPVQLKNYIKKLITDGMLKPNEKLPSTRELSSILSISRNSVLSAYEALEDDGFIKLVSNVGAFVLEIQTASEEHWDFNWENLITDSAKIAESYDILKGSFRTERHIINLRGLSPDKELFNTDSVRRAFLNILSREERNILNYGYANGYKPLADYILHYMESKGIHTENRGIVITNGFTEGFNVVLSSICTPGSTIICENPTHNTSIKIMKMHGINIVGIPLKKDGLDTVCLEDALNRTNPTAGYFVPSYHNPTGTVMTLEKRQEVYTLFKKHNVPIIEDGFCEELRYSGAHLPSIAALSGNSSGNIYIGSFSKILFPGIRIGWVLADKRLIKAVESVKKSLNIHTSVLDQAVLYQYLQEGNFDKCIRKSRRLYRERYAVAMEYAEKYIPNEYITGDGGMYIFLKLKGGIDSTELLMQCREKDVVFMPGNDFFTEGGSNDTLRISFANSSCDDIKKGIQIIGQTAESLIGINCL